MTTPEQRADFLARRDRIRTELGGVDRVERLRKEGKLNARERVDRLLDPGSFFEIGTFAHSQRKETATRTPADGKITGFGTIDGQKVAVLSDDHTVLAGSGGAVGSAKTQRVFDLALDKGFPMVVLGEGGGARIPDILEAATIGRGSNMHGDARRARRVPLATAILGDSFGGPSWYAAFSDFVVQLRGTCMAVSGPQVIEMAIGEKTTTEQLGGVEVHARKTGQIDRIAETEDEAFAIVRRFLSFLPPNSWSLPPRSAPPARVDPDPELLTLVPAARTRGYDMRKVLRRLTDDGDIFELKPDFGRPMITALARVGGYSVGFVASNPMFQAGALDTDCCDKGTLFLALCDAFNIPLVYLIDTPGFVIGTQVEHNRLLSRAIMFLEALALSEVPKVTVMVRKAFGLGFVNLCGPGGPNDLLFAWPGVELSQLDPETAVNVVYKSRIQQATDPKAERKALMDEFMLDTSPYAAAGSLNVDEIIDPPDTRAVLIRALGQVQVPPPAKGYRKPLSYWPTCL